MRLITVIPIARGIFRETLTYFSAEDIPLGAITLVPVRNREISSLVVGSEDIKEAKAGIKKASFSLKKVLKVKAGFLSPQFIRAVERTAHFYVAGKGSVLQAFIPKAILESANEIASAKNETGSPGNNKAGQSGLNIEKLSFQAPDEDRVTAYKSLIREEFAKNSSVFICLPNAKEAEKYREKIEKGITEYTFSFHGGETKKALIAKWKKVLSLKHPVVIVGTPAYLSLSREDLGVIIVENEHSRAYRTFSRPELDARKFMEFLAEERRIKIIFGDRFLRIETLKRYYESELSPFTSMKFKLSKEADGIIVDMKEQRAGKQGGKYSALSRELKAVIELSLREREHLAVISSRRGLYGITACNDCGTLVSCPECKAPMALHEKGSVRLYLCHKCGAKRILHKDSEEKCASCGSWRLTPLSSGTEGIEKEIRAEFPEAKIIRVDSDTAKTDKAVSKLINDFHKTGGAVLVGTEPAISALEKPVERSAILGIDTLFAIPDFRVNERIFSIILSLREKTDGTILIQTQDAEQTLLSEALRGDLLPFYRREIEERKNFNYPPFSVLIKIIWETKPARVETETAALSEKFSAYNPRAYTLETAGVKGGTRAVLLIKVPVKEWPDETLISILKSLPLKYTVAIDPESVL